MLRIDFPALETTEDQRTETCMSTKEGEGHSLGYEVPEGCEEEECADVDGDYAEQELPYACIQD